MKASEIIDGARLLLDREDSWIQGLGFRVEPGGWTRRCVSSALFNAARGLDSTDMAPLQVATSYVKQEAGTSGHLAAWNDDPMTLYSDVQLVLKRAFHAALEAGD